MRRRPVGTWVLGAAVLLGLATLSLPASAHTGGPAAERASGAIILPTEGPGPDVRPSTAPPGASGVLVGMMLLTLIASRLAGTRHWRGVVLPALVGLLCLSAFEGGVHSVHHFGDPGAIHSCAVLASGTHVAGVDADAPSLGRPTWVAYLAPVADAEVFSSDSWFRPAEGRAPPPVSAR